MAHEYLFNLKLKLLLLLLKALEYDSTQIGNSKKISEFYLYVYNSFFELNFVR